MSSGITARHETPIEELITIGIPFQVPDDFTLPAGTGPLPPGMHFHGHRIASENSLRQEHDLPLRMRWWA